MSDSWQRVTRCQGIESDKAMEIQALGFEPSTPSTWSLVAQETNSLLLFFFCVKESCPIVVNDLFSYHWLG